MWQPDTISTKTTKPAAACTNLTGDLFARDRVRYTAYATAVNVVQRSMVGTSTLATDKSMTTMAILLITLMPNQVTILQSNYQDKYWRLYISYL